MTLTLTGATTLYQLPEDADAVLAAILGAINRAQTTVRLFMYGFTSTDIGDALVAAQQRGVDVALLLDHTQSCGPSESQLLNRMLRAGLKPESMAITTSPVKRQIMHEKLLLCDGAVMFGSLNFSPTGFEQVNTWLVVADSALAAQQLAAFEDRFAWALKTEPQYQKAAAA